MVGKKFAKYVTPTRKQVPTVYPSAAAGSGLGPGQSAPGPGLGPGPAAQGPGLGHVGMDRPLVGSDGMIDFHATIPMDFFLQASDHPSPLPYSSSTSSFVTLCLPFLPSPFYSPLTRFTSISPLTHDNLHHHHHLFLTPPMVPQQVRLLAIDRLTPVDTLSTRPLPGGILSPLEIGKNALDKANRAMEKAQRARRAQKGERRREGGDPLEDEEIYPHYDIDGNDDVILSHRGEGMTGHSTINESLYRFAHSTTHILL